MYPLASSFFEKTEWILRSDPVSYSESLTFMTERVGAIYNKKAPTTLWLLEHPPLITLGTSGSLDDVYTADLPVYRTGRGGKATYHGPGQRVVYVMMDLSFVQHDLHYFVKCLEKWILLTLKTFSLHGFTDPQRVGVWVNQGKTVAKIASIGIRVRKWVSFHGFALNVNPDLGAFDHIIPCGVRAPVCSMHSLGVKASLSSVDAALQETFSQVFNV